MLIREDRSAWPAWLGVCAGTVLVDKGMHVLPNVNKAVSWGAMIVGGLVLLWGGYRLVRSRATRSLLFRLLGVPAMLAGVYLAATSLCAFLDPASQVSLSLATWPVHLSTVSGRFIGTGLGAVVTALGFAAYRIGEQNQ